jgi:leucyl/phenylalanyl-tRNA--protein transferase
MVLDPDLVLRAYMLGLFPMAESRGSRKIIWVEPRRRAILPLHQFRMSRSLRRTIRSDRFAVTHDRAFPRVIEQCAQRDETWINGEIEATYNLLHRLGHAHSIECWQEGELVGGLYGVCIGPAFFGESMFSLRADASKVALAWLVARLLVGGFRLLDCQFMTEHLRSLGAVELPQKDYVALLSAVLSGSGAGDGASAGAAGSLVAGGEAAGALVAPADGAAGPPEFGALDRLLAGLAASEGAAPGWVIAQLLGQTS